MTDDRTELLRSFIANENEALSSGQQGKFWPRNHHLISPLAAKAAGLLAPDERIDFYFHTMRVTGAVPPVGDREMPLLIEAYRRLLPLLDLGGFQMGRRHTLLFVFGFDETGILPSGETVSAKALKTRLKLVQQVGNYTSQPAQREKKARFIPFTDQAARILETFRHLGYRHDRRYDEDSYDVTNLSFWGMALICLLAKSTRRDLVADMTEGKFDLARREQQFSMLHRYVEAVLPDIEPDEDHFHALAARLGEIELVRRNATESVALAQNLDLPFGAGDDWDIRIAIPLRGSEDHPLTAKDAVRLHIRPDPDWQWEVNLRALGREAFSESEKKCWRNDLGLPVLGPGNLHAFPVWLKRIRRNNGLDFSIESADIRVGRKRAAAKLIARWLED